jgi:hypothetical protein
VRNGNDGIVRKGKPPTGGLHPAGVQFAPERPGTMPSHASDTASSIHPILTLVNMSNSSLDTHWRSGLVITDQAEEKRPVSPGHRICQILQFAR